jgi:hypothetical protein
MLVSEVSASGPFVGNGSASVFPYAFKIFDAADLVVTHTDEGGVETVLTQDDGTGRGYESVTGVGSTDGGTISYTVDGVVTALPADEELLIERLVDYVQETNFQQPGGLSAESVEDAFDFLTMQTQQLDRQYTALQEAVDGIIGSIGGELITGELTAGYIPLANGTASLTDSLISQSAGVLSTAGVLSIEAGLRWSGLSLAAIASSRLTVTDAMGPILVGGGTNNLDEIIGGTEEQMLLLSPSSGVITIRHDIAPSGGGEPILTRGGLSYTIAVGEDALLIRATAGWVLLSPARDAAGVFTTLSTSALATLHSLSVTNNATFNALALFADGSVGAPSLAGTNYTTTGRSWAAGPVMRESVGGVQVVEYAGDVVTFGVPVDAAFGARFSATNAIALTSNRITLTGAMTGIVVTGGTGTLNEIIGGELGQIILLTPFSGVLTLEDNATPSGGGLPIRGYDGLDYELEQYETALLVCGATYWQLISPTSAGASGSVSVGTLAPGTEGQVLATVGGVAAWATILGLQCQNGSEAAPSLTFVLDLDTGTFLAAADTYGITAGGVERARWGATEYVGNEGGFDYDHRWETEDTANAMVLDGAGTGTFALNVPATINALLTLTAGLVANTADINGGTADAVVLGGTTPAAATVTTLSASGTVTVNGGTFNFNAGNANVDARFGTTGTDTAFVLDANGAAAGGGQATFNVPLIVASGRAWSGSATIALTSSRITVTDLNGPVLVSGGTGNLDEIIGGALEQELLISPAAGVLTIRHNIAPTGGGQEIYTYDGLNYAIEPEEQAWLIRAANGWNLITPNRPAAGSYTNLTATGTINFSGATVSNGGTVTTVDINGGTVDGANIGASSRGTGAFTTLGANSTVTLDGGAFAFNASLANVNFSLGSDLVADAFLLDANGSDEAQGLISTNVPFAAAAGFAMGGDGGDATKAVSSSRLTVEDNVGHVVATGGAVNLDEIIGGKNTQFLLISPFTGTTLTIRHNIAPTGGGLRIYTFGGGSYVVSVNEYALLYRQPGGGAWNLLLPTTGLT